MIANASQSRWTVRRRPNPDARIRLFCFPFAGSGASAFRAWPSLLPDWIEVVAIQLPGRENRINEAPYDSINRLMPPLAAEMFKQSDGAFAVFGHSLGALIAFEVCRYLRSEGRPPPVALFVSAHAAPQIPLPGPFIHRLPDADFVRELRRYHGTPEAVFQSADLLAMIVPSLRADFTMLETYEYDPQGPFAFPIVAFAGQDDPEAPAVLLEPWEEQTTAGFELLDLPGDHFFLHTSRERLLSAVTAHLERLASRPAGL